MVVPISKLGWVMAINVSSEQAKAKGDDPAMAATKSRKSSLPL